MTALLLSVVIPCYNEEGNLAHLHDRLKTALKAYERDGVEVILIDDGSKDETWKGIEGLSAKDKRVVGIKLSRNFGHQMALACGLSHASGERVLVIDADLQDPPELLPTMMAKMDEGYDVVYGKRTARKGEKSFKRWSAWAFYRVLMRLSDVPIPPDTGDFRLMKKRVSDALAALPERVRFTRGLVSWLGYKQTAVEYVREARFAGQTNYPFSAMLRLAAAGITSFSTRPLRIAIWLGIFMMLISFGMLGYVFISWLNYNTVRGWTSLAGTFLLFQGLQFLLLGVIGGYLSVIFREIKGRPLYLVDQIVGKEKAS